MIILFVEMSSFTGLAAGFHLGPGERWHRRVFVRLRVLGFLVLATALAGGCSRQGEPVTIEPGVAVGLLHSGMTLEQVISQLGQPDRTNDSHFEYSRLGLSVVSGQGGAVERVIIAQPFAGRTKEGIGIGSSRADVIRAYGAPAFDKPGTSGYEFLRYGQLGFVFQLHNGKTDLMTVIFPKPK